MARNNFHGIAGCTLLLLAGCSRTPTEQIGEAPPATEVPAAVNEIASFGQETEPPLFEPAARATEADRRAAQLAREIDGHRRRGYDDQAVAARREMLQLFQETHGKESWQARSAQLALWREECLNRFSAEQRSANDAAEERTHAANELWAAGKRDEALAAIVEARGRAIKIWGEQTYGVANLLDQEAHWRLSAGDKAEAEKLFRQALAIREQVFTPNHPESIATASALGRVLLAAGRPDDAAPLLRKSVEAAGKVWGESHAEYAGQLNNLALYYLETGNYRQAAEHFSRAASVWRTALGEGHPLVGEASLNVGRAWYAAGDYVQAEGPLREALASLEKNAGAAHASTRRARVALGLAEMAQRNYQDAETILRADLTIVTGQFGESHPETAEALMRLAILYGNQGRYDEALPMAERGAAVHRAAAGEQNPLTRNADSVLALVRDRLARNAATVAAGSPTSTIESDRPVRTNFEDPVKR
jgi:tetratricopeptide (TPR) repeat protein